MAAICSVSTHPKFGFQITEAKHPETTVRHGRLTPGLNTDDVCLTESATANIANHGIVIEPKQTEHRNLCFTRVNIPSAFQSSPLPNAQVDDWFESFRISFISLAFCTSLLALCLHSFRREAFVGRPRTRPFAAQVRQVIEASAIKKGFPLNMLVFGWVCWVCWLCWLCCLQVCGSWVCAVHEYVAHNVNNVNKGVRPADQSLGNFVHNSAPVLTVSQLASSTPGSVLRMFANRSESTSSARKNRPVGCFRQCTFVRMHSSKCRP